MSASRLKEASRTPELTPLDVCEYAGLDEQARGTAKPEMPLRTWVEQLASSGLQREAIAALAQVLPRRAAVSWGFDVVRRIAPAPAGTKAESAIQSVEQWLGDASDDRRRQAGDAAAQAGYGSAAGCLALAVFLSGGSMGPKDSPGPEPQPKLFGRALAGGISLAVAGDARNAVQHRRVILDEGFRVAEANAVWKR